MDLNLSRRLLFLMDLWDFWIQRNNFFLEKCLFFLFSSFGFLGGGKLPYLHSDVRKTRLSPDLIFYNGKR